MEPIFVHLLAVLSPSCLRCCYCCLPLALPRHGALLHG